MQRQPHPTLAQPAKNPPVGRLFLASAPHCVRSDGTAVALAVRDAALLAWLALEGPTPRARLGALLWPDSEAAAARNALRQRLFMLRKTLGFDAVVGSVTLVLATGLTHDLDAADSVLGDAAPAAAGEFAAWLEQQRSRRRGRLQQSLAELAQMAEDARDWPDALAYAREALALEPLSEAAHRRVMRLHYLAGDRAAALLAFDHCERVLKDEVGAAPSAETLALLATIDQGAASGALSVGNAVPASVLRPPRMIGREHELAQLAQGFAGGLVVAVIGEAGLGKTRLLQECAQAQAGLVHVSARPGDAGVPFASLARLLRAVTALAPSPPALEDSTRREIARVLPEFDSAAPRVGGEGQRLVLQRAVKALLASQQNLTGLLVDDLHFADPASLDMLLTLIDATGSSDGQREAGLTAAPPLRWALAYRPAEAGSPLHGLHDALVEQVRLQPLALAPLDEAALAALVDSLRLPGVDGRTLAPGLRQRTGGNPLFVLETLKQAWVERTLHSLADAQQLPRPLSVGRLIQRRVGQLSPAALALARVASIAGLDFEIALAEQVLGVTAMQFADALNELEAAQVLRGDAFAHDLVFEAVQASVPATIAARTHGQVAAWLEARAGEPARVAEHWIAAQQGLRALPWLQLAADAARRALRAKEYVAFMERKSRIEEQADLAEAAFISLLAAAEEFVNVDLDAAVSSTHCDRLDRLASTPAQRAEALLQRGHLHQQRGEYERAEHLARAALNASVVLSDTALTVRCRRALSVACVMGNRFGEASQQLEACIAWVDQHSGDAERSEAHGDLAVMYDNLGRLEDALPHHRLAYDLSRRCGNLSNASTACSNYACNRLDAGQLAAAEQSLQQGQQLLAAYDGFGAHTGTLQVLRALCLCHLGRYADALVQAELGVASTLRYQPGRADNARVRLASCWWHLGQSARLGQQLDAVTVDAQSDLSVRVMHARLSSWHANARDASAASIEAARQALLATAASLGDDRPDLRLPLAIDLAAGAEPELALRQLDAIRAEAERIGHWGVVLAAHIRAAGAATACDPHRARREALAALALADQGRQTTSSLPAELWLNAGRALAAAGDAAKSAEVLTQGRAWLQTTAREQVPEPFRDSFLHRNPVNRELLALAARLSEE